MKKYGLIVLALALLASLCGCSTGEGEASASPEPAATGPLGVPIEGENISFEFGKGPWPRPSGVMPSQMLVRVLEEDHYIGYAVVSVNWGRDSGEITISRSFPKVDGAYQNITERELNAAATAAMEEYQARRKEANSAPAASSDPEEPFGLRIGEGKTRFEVRLLETVHSSGRFMEVRFLEEGHYVGHTLVRGDFGGLESLRSGDIVMCQEFPKVDGEYQDITEEWLDGEIEAALKAYCDEYDSVESKHIYPPVICWDGKLYAYLGASIKKVSIIGPVLGQVTSVVEETELPQEDGQANSSMYEGGVYFAKCGDGLSALVDGKWLWLPYWGSRREE